jgi:hypothetical protein
MKQNIIILNRVDIEESPYHDWLDDKYNIYLITATGKFEKAQSERCKYTEIHEFNNFMCNANVELFALELAAKVDIHAIVAYSEADIIRAARIRAALGLPGQNVENGVIYRDKLKMRELSVAKSLRAPSFMAVESMSELSQFIEDNNYPFIIKPRFGMAAIGVQKISNKSDLTAFLETNLYSAPDIAQPFIAESFVNGDVYAIDVLVVDNKIVVAEPLLYINTCLNYASSESKTVSLSQVPKGQPIYDNLMGFCHELISKFPHAGFGGFHIEVFIDNEDNITLCEVASRNGGGKIPQLFEEIHGVNPDAISVRLQASLGEDRAWIEQEIKTDYQGALGFIIMSPGNADSGWKLPKSVEFDFVTEYEPDFDVIKTVEDVANAAAIVTISGSSIDEVKSNMKQFIEWFYKASA